MVFLCFSLITRTEQHWKLLYERFESFTTWFAVLLSVGARVRLPPGTPVTNAEDVFLPRSLSKYWTKRWFPAIRMRCGDRSPRHQAARQSGANAACINSGPSDCKMSAVICASAVPPWLPMEIVYNEINKSEFVERLPELSLFYRLFSQLDSEMICIFPYFCPYAESAREIRKIFC